jgi:multidrug resistance efflux pump
MSEQVDVERLLALAHAIQYGSYEDDEDARDEVAQLRAAAAEITALRAELVETHEMVRARHAALIAAEADAARLEWLDRDDVELKPTTASGRPTVLILSAKNGTLIAKGDNIRAAIDAAMSERK